jgi:hypothetical protein
MIHVIGSLVPSRYFQGKPSSHCLLNTNSQKYDTVEFLYVSIEGPNNFVRIKRIFELSSITMKVPYSDCQLFHSFN